MTNIQREDIMMKHMTIDTRKQLDLVRGELTEAHYVMIEGNEAYRTDDIEKARAYIEAERELELLWKEIMR